MSKNLFVFQHYKGQGVPVCQKHTPSFFLKKIILVPDVPCSAFKELVVFQHYKGQGVPVCQKHTPKKLVKILLAL